MKLWKIKANIRKMIYDIIEPYLSTEYLNEVSNELTDKFYTIIQSEAKEMFEKYTKEKDSIVHEGEGFECHHQYTWLYYGSNRRINETYYKICFKCKRIKKEIETE